MFKAILFIAAGFYAGIYADQRYKVRVFHLWIYAPSTNLLTSFIPNVADPHALLTQLKETLEKYKKDDSTKDS